MILSTETPVRTHAIAMLVHVLGLIAVFAGFAIQHRAGARLRKTTRYEEARLWAELLLATRAMVPSGAVMLLVSGGYLSRAMWPNLPAWLVVAIASVLFIGVMALAVGRRFAAMNASLAVGEGPLSAVAKQTIGDTFAWAAHSAANGAALGTLWLMAANPGTLEAVLAVLLPAAIGLVVGVRLARRARGTA
jgi:hypothetical protein